LYKLTAVEGASFFAQWKFSNNPDTNAIKLSNKLPLLLERAGVRRIKTKAKYFILIPSS
jgi:hypothetical protein